MRPALRPGDRVHLVQDQGADARENRARLRREHQKERLGGGDQDLRRRAEHLRPLAGRGVARADGDGELRADPGDRAAKVALDVVVERLQRADVEHLGALARDGAVERPEERGERLPRSGRRLDQDVRARGDRRPATLLGRRRSLERALEPLADGRAEGREGSHGPRLAVDGLNRSPPLIYPCPRCRSRAPRASSTASREPWPRADASGARAADPRRSRRRSRGSGRAAPIARASGARTSRRPRSGSAGRTARIPLLSPASARDRPQVLLRDLQHRRFEVLLPIPAGREASGRRRLPSRNWLWRAERGQLPLRLPRRPPSSAAKRHLAPSGVVTCRSGAGVPTASPDSGSSSSSSPWASARSAVLALAGAGIAR